jgi:hypothetical protein
MTRLSQLNTKRANEMPMRPMKPPEPGKPRSLPKNMTRISKLPMRPMNPVKPPEPGKPRSLPKNMTRISKLHTNRAKASRKARKLPKPKSLPISMPKLSKRLTISPIALLIKRATTMAWKTSKPINNPKPKPKKMKKRNRN